MNAKEYATQNSIKVGATVTGLGRAAVDYRISAVDGKGFEMIRPSGKPVRVTWRMVEETLARLQAGEAVRFQGNRSKGGIDGTSAKRDAVLAALQGVAVRDGDLVVLADLAAWSLAGYPPRTA